MMIDEAGDRFFQIVPLIFSAVSCICSGYVFIRFDRKLRSQAIELNEIKLKQNKENEALGRSAQIEVSLKTDSSNNILSIKNIGRSVAHNVFVGCDSGVLSGAIFKSPMLNPSQTVDQQIVFGRLEQNYVSVHTEWDDDNGHHDHVQIAHFVME